MKRTLKLTLIILLIISLAFVVTGCGNKDQDNSTSTNETQENTKSKTYNALTKAFSGDDYIMTVEGEMDSGNGLEDTTVTVAVKGENVYMGIKATSGNMTVMYKDNTTYIISHDDKKYMMSEGKNEQLFQEDMMVFSKDDLNELETAKYTTGKETIDGTEYEYEEYVDEENGSTDRYYFSGDDLIYIKSTNDNGEAEITKVLKLSSEVDESIFEIPSDYQSVQM